MLVFGTMVSTEMTVCGTLLGSVWCTWRLLHRVTWGRLLGSLIFLGLLVLSKLTCVLMLPLTACLVAVKLAGGRPPGVAPGPTPLDSGALGPSRYLCGPLRAARAVGLDGHLGPL